MLTYIVGTEGWPMFTEAELEKQLAQLVAAHGVPGAQLAVLDGDGITEVAAGVLSLRTGCPVRPDALFLPGSIGKVYTATLVMQLVGDGIVDLDAPVRRYLPAFTVGDADAAAAVTARHLLCHTSGFDGDRFTDTGRGDDALARYVDGLADLPQIARPGSIWSYSNSGYAILGRLVEVLTEGPYEDALRARIFGPLRLQQSVCFAEEAINHPVSVGHVPNPEEPTSLEVSPTWGLFRSTGPMGASLVASAGDVLRFARAHLDGGRSPSGESWLSPHLVTAMQTEQARLVDDTVLGRGWGLGWLLDEWGDVRVIGHDGNSFGQNAFLRLAPDARFGFCLHTNVESALTLYREVAGWLFGQRLGVGPRPDPDPLPDQSVPEPGRYTGRYEHEGVVFDVTADERRRLFATVTASHAAAEAQQLPPMEHLPLRPVARGDSFLLTLPIADAPLLTVFFDPDGGEVPTYLHFGGRASKRVQA
jgi:CubicO group peptidase (beta-lactamase class C family)